MMKRHRLVFATWSRRRLTTMPPLPIRYSWSTRRRERIDMSRKNLCLSRKKRRRLGFIVAYADHRTMSPKTVEELAEIPGLIEKKWCIDTNGFSSPAILTAGLTAMAIAFLNGTKHIPAAIAPSAMGIRGEDLKAYQCPNPLPVMVMHSGQDTHFPGYGKEAIQWWAACNGCDATPPVKDANGCVTYKGCRNNVATRYCEGTGSHATWPGNNKAIIDFFKGSQDVR